MSHKEFKKAQVYTEPIPNLKGSFSFNVLPQIGENMTFITLVVITALCFLLPTTRLYAVIGAGMLLYFYTYLTIGVHLFAGIAFYFHRRKSHAKLYPRRP
jgi:fatty-acid desaturase